MSETPAPPAPAITGYRKLNDAEVALMNEGKALAIQVGNFIEKVRGTPKAPVPEPVAGDLPSHDPRWLAIGQTQLQQGFMALLRSIAQPTTF